MGSKEFIQFAKELIVKYFNERADKSDKNGHITTDDVFVVWSSKILQNSKALLSTTVPDGMYYEITLNGSNKEVYLDAYKKWENRCIPIGS